MAKLKIGIAGCGAIGTSLAKTIVSEFSGQAELAGVYDSDARKSAALAGSLANPKSAFSNLKDLIACVDLVIEATRLEAACDIVKDTLLSSKSILVMSVGGIVKEYKELEVLARKNNSRIFIPSGAICGIDGVKALACGKLTKVILTTKKPPGSFKGVPFITGKNLDDIKEDTVIFEGNALSAIEAFPQNINVAATLSIAGLGPERTMVRIVASPKVTRNTHEIEIESESGRIVAFTENVVHPDNPKTSYLAVLSAVAVLKQILTPLRIGT